ncbi:mucin-17-like [Limulus polyphemus]|uniref:Mucin-17-like n=1 Tax=Limulus polyphemus TaxID=6850 RepID=A0ABM1B2K7_LIMPO|nr:mucin-17-like [Limulus polyphemus]
MLFLSDSESEHENDVGTNRMTLSGDNMQGISSEENNKLDKKEDKTPIIISMPETLSCSLKTVEEEQGKIELDKSTKLETSPVTPGTGSLENNFEPPSSESAEDSGKSQSPINQHILTQTGSNESQQTHSKGFETPISKLSTAKRMSTRKKRMSVEEHEPSQTVRSTRSRTSKTNIDGTISESSVEIMKTQKSGSSESTSLIEKTKSPGATAKGSRLTMEEVKEHESTRLEEEEDSPKTRSRVSSQEQREMLVSPVKIAQESSSQLDIKKEHILDSLSTTPLTTSTPGVVTRAERRRRESTTSEDSERYDPSGYTKFTFTEPTVPEEREVLDLPPFDTSKTSAMSFIFSPPITRSRTRRRRSEDIGSDVESYTPPRRQFRDPLLSDSPTSVTSTDLDMVSETQAVVITTKTKETKPKPRSKKGKPPAHSIINLISPVPEESSTAVASSSRGLKKTGTQAKHTMTLRKAKLQSRRRVKL